MIKISENLYKANVFCSVSKDSIESHNFMNVNWNVFGNCKEV